MHLITAPAASGKGDATFMEVLIWNIRTRRFDVKGQIQAANLQELNTDAKHRGGLVGSSVETPLKGVERINQII
jgi:hypothetical protein